MLSLDNALDESELRAFDARVRELLNGEEFVYVAELKMDGLSMAARYRDGFFEQAITRGDGTVGEDVDRKTPAPSRLQCPPRRTAWWGIRGS